MALSVAAGLVVRRWRAGPGCGNWPVARLPTADRRRWHVVTVNRSRDELLSHGRLPEPLSRLGDGVQVRLRPAPGRRGTELAARLRDGEPQGLAGMAAQLSGDEPGLAIRLALRLTRQLVETGEALGMDAVGMIRGEVRPPGSYRAHRSAEPAPERSPEGGPAGAGHGVRSGSAVPGHGVRSGSAVPGRDDAPAGRTPR